jgi:hypothetical protein
MAAWGGDFVAPFARSPCNGIFQHWAHQGDASVSFTDPLSAVILAPAAAVFVLPLLFKLKRG